MIMEGKNNIKSFKKSVFSTVTTLGDNTLWSEFQIGGFGISGYHVTTLPQSAACCQPELTSHDIQPQPSLSLQRPPLEILR